MHSARPTLPPLRSLNLPRGDTQLHDAYHDLDEQTRRTTQLHIPATLPHAAPPTRSLPPAPCLRPCTNAPASFPVRKVRLVYTSFENADAVLLVLPPSSPNVPPPQPLLLVGPALRRKRHLAKGTRVHPYRIVRGPPDRHPQTGPADTSLTHL